MHSWFKDELTFFWQELKQQFADAYRFVVQHRRTYLLSAIIVLILLTLLFPHDSSIIASIQHPEKTPVHQVAHQISYWGDFQTATVLLCLTVWGIGFAIGRPSIRSIALACMLSAIVAGACTNAFRFTLGRPRPSAEMADGLYGLQSKAAFHGFPSGHSATSVGTAAPLIAINPLLGVPAVLASNSVGWSRMQLNRHYLTDVIAGGSIGLLVGLAFGSPLRRRLAEARIPSTPSAIEADPA